MALALLILLIEDDNRQNERSCSLLAHLGNFTKDGASKWRALSFSAPLYEKRWRWKLICCLHRTAFWCVKRARLAPPPPSLKPLIWMKSFERGGNLLIHTHTHTLNRENYCQTVIRIFSFIKSNINQSDWGLPKNNVCLSGASCKYLVHGWPFGFPCFLLCEGVYFIFYLFKFCPLDLLELAKLGEAQLSCGGPNILQVLCFWELAGSFSHNRSTKCTFCVRVEIL